jgi:hypothetical protein
LAARATEVILVERLRPRAGLLKTWKIRGCEKRENGEIKSSEGEIRRDKAGN